MKCFSQNNDFTPSLGIWLAFWAYTAFVALLVQFILLPYFFPQWHAGNGLLAGLDSVSFHHIAVNLSLDIKAHGWSVWQLRPEGQAPAGLAAAIYALTVPKPWTIIPLNAALHATAGFVLLKIVQIFIPDWRKAIWAVIPFIIFPSAMTWYTQIHKDGFFIAGMLIFLLGLIRLAKLETWTGRWWKPFKTTVLILVGAVLVWIVRPYGVQMMQVFGAGIFIILTGHFVILAEKKVLPRGKIISVLFVIGMILILLTPLSKGGITAEIPSKDLSTSTSTSTSSSTLNNSRWQASNFIPQALENKFYTIAIVRDGFRQSYPNAGSNIDTNVAFHKVWDIICYLPRAMEISFLSPFPNQWLANGTIESNTMMRRISMFEMIGIYTSYIFLIYTLWYWRKRLEIWIIIAFCGGMMLCYSVVIPNIGTLYRTRYGFLMTLMALGIAGGLNIIEKIHSST